MPNIRIESASASAGGGVELEASLLNDDDGSVICAKSFHFDAGVGEGVVAIVVSIEREMTKALAEKQRQDALLAALPVGSVFPLRDEQAAKTFIGIV
jgi:hypothetical protein